MTPLLLALATVLAAPGDVSLSVTVEPPITPFHKQIAVSVVVEAPEDMQVKLPQLADRFGGLEVYGLPDFHSERASEGMRRTTETYTLDPIKVGDYRVEPITITYGEDGELTVPGPIIRVRALTPEEEEEALAFDEQLARPDLDARPWYLEWYAIAGALAIVAALFALVMWWRRKPTRVHTPPPKKPWEVAYERLRALDERQLAKAGKYDPFYVDLSAILRYYIEDRFQLHAPERTTPEFLEEVQGSKLLTDEQERYLARFLRHCDRVKFAQYQPEIAEMERSFTEVLQFVDDTIPTATPDEEQAA